MLRIECRGSPYHQHTALYPCHRPPGAGSAPGARTIRRKTRLRKLEEALRPSRARPWGKRCPLLAALLSLPLPTERYAPLPLTPQRQKQKTLEALLTLLLTLTEQQPVLFIVEDLHWIDPSTLELLSLLVDQGPTTRLLTAVHVSSGFSAALGHGARISLRSTLQSPVPAPGARS